MSAIGVANISSWVKSELDDELKKKGFCTVPDQKIGARDFWLINIAPGRRNSGSSQG